MLERLCFCAASAVQYNSMPYAVAQVDTMKERAKVRSLISEVFSQAGAQLLAVCLSLL
jgi:hypothetical protein